MQKAAGVSTALVLGAVCFGALLLAEDKSGSTPAAVATADWPCWRGPNSDGKNPMKGIRKDWTGGLKMVWEVTDLCQGKDSETWGAPSVKDGKLVVPGRQDDNDVIFCYEASTGGKPLWKFSYPATGKGGGYGLGMRATPTIDGDKIYTLGSLGHLSCINLADGKQVWQKNLMSDFKGAKPSWNYSGSPFVTGGLVIVQAGGATGTVALKKETGEMAWTSNTGAAGYATALLAKIGGQDQLLIFSGPGINGLDPKTGKILWKSEWKTAHDVNATTPVVDGDTVFITSGYGTGCQALQIANGAAKELWKSKVIASHHSDPVLIDGYLYGYSGQSNGGDALKCVELKTGKEAWSAGKEAGWGMLLLVDGLLLCLNNNGTLLLVEPTPTAFKKVAEFNAIKGNPVWTVPVVAAEKVFVRHKEHLICYDLKK